MKEFNFRPYILLLIMVAPIVALVSITLIENEAWQIVYGLVFMPLVVLGSGVGFYLLASSTRCPNCKKPVNFHSYWLRAPSFPDKCAYCGHELKKP